MRSDLAVPDRSATVAARSIGARETETNELTYKPTIGPPLRSGAIAGHEYVTEWQQA